MYIYIIDLQNSEMPIKCCASHGHLWINSIFTNKKQYNKTVRLAILSSNIFRSTHRVYGPDKIGLGPKTLPVAQIFRQVRADQATPWYPGVLSPLPSLATPGTLQQIVMTYDLHGQYRTHSKATVILVSLHYPLLFLSIKLGSGLNCIKFKFIKLATVTYRMT